jgi:hypothetical protein
VWCSTHGTKHRPPWRSPNDHFHDAEFQYNTGVSSVSFGKQCQRRCSAVQLLRRASCSRDRKALCCLTVVCTLAAVERSVGSSMSGFNISLPAAFLGFSGDARLSVHFQTRKNASFASDSEF